MISKFICYQCFIFSCAGVLQLLSPRIPMSRKRSAIFLGRVFTTMFCNQSVETRPKYGRPLSCRRSRLALLVQVNICSFSTCQRKPYLTRKNSGSDSAFIKGAIGSFLVVDLVQVINSDKVCVKNLLLGLIEQFQTLLLMTPLVPSWTASPLQVILFVPR